MVRVITVFIAGFLSCLSLCWIVYIFYPFFWQQFHQKEVKNENVAEAEIKELKEKISEKESSVSEQKEPETEAKPLQILDPMNEPTQPQDELTMALWRFFKNRFYSESGFKQLRRPFKERFFENSELSELTDDSSEEEEAKIQFCYDQWILLENFIFTKKAKIKEIKEEILDPRNEEKESQLQLRLWRLYKDRWIRLENFKKEKIKEIKEEILDPRNEEKESQLQLRLWRLFKERYYAESDLKESRRRFKERFFENSELSELTDDSSEEEEANFKFWYDQWILLENYLFGK